MMASDTLIDNIDDIDNIDNIDNIDDMGNGKPVRSARLEESAKGQDCTLNITGVCNDDPATTVLAHLPDQFNSIATQGFDLTMVYACSSCHDMVEGRVEPTDEYRYTKELIISQARQRTQLRQLGRGRRIVKGDNYANR